MAPHTAQELVCLASSELHQLSYLQNLPEQMVSTVDTALTVEDATYPVHSFVLMSASPIFAGMVAAHYAEKTSGKTAAVLTIPLLGSQKRGTQSALQFMYQQSLLCKDKVLPVLDKLEEAEYLVEFAHKWNIQLLLQAGDKILCKQISRQCHLDTSSRFGTTNSEKAIIVIQTAVKAESMSLPRTLAFCEKWLVRKFSSNPDVHTQLYMICQQSMLRVMTGLASLKLRGPRSCSSVSSSEDDTDMDEDDDLLDMLP